MAISTDWELLAVRPSPDVTVTNGLPDDQFDLTSYIKGCEVISECEFGKVGEASITLVLENSTAFFTPGYDGSIYDYDIGYDINLGWFNDWLLILNATATDGTTTFTDSGRRAFSITDVEYQDDGYSSEVMVYGRDFTHLIERVGLSDVTLGSQSAIEGIRRLITDFVEAPGTGGLNWDYPVPPLGVTIQYGDSTLTYPDGVSVLEIMRDIAANESLLMLPMHLYTWTKAGSFLLVNATNLVRAQTPNNFSGYGELFFSDPTGIAAGRDDGGTTVYDLLPYRALQFGSTTDRLITESHQANSAGTSSTATNTTSTATYGARSDRFTVMPVTTPPSFYGGGTDQDFLDDKTAMRVAWWDKAENYVEGLELSQGMIEQLAQDDALGDVYTIMTNGLFARCNIVINGAGGTLRTADNTFLRSVLTINPTEWVVRLERGIGETSAFTFTLDDDDLGVLDENRVAAPTRS